jgi:hypothetical protein
MRRCAALEKICAPQLGDEQIDRCIARKLKRAAKVEASILAGLGVVAGAAKVIVFRGGQAYALEFKGHGRHR